MSNTIEKRIREIFAALEKAHADTMVKVFEARARRDWRPPKVETSNDVLARQLNWIIIKRLAGY